MFSLLQEKMELYREENQDQEIFEEIIHESLAFDDEIEDLMDYDDQDFDDDEIEAQLSELESTVGKITRDSNLVSATDLREEEDFGAGEDDEIVSEDSLELDYLYDYFA